MIRGALGSRSSLRRRRRICTSILRSKTSSCTRVACSSCSRLRRLEKGKQQCVLALGQDYRSAVWVSELPGLSVELPPGKSKATALAIPPRSDTSFRVPSQHRAHTREQFAEVEWLRQVIVGSELKPDHPIDVVAEVTG